MVFLKKTMLKQDLKKEENSNSVTSKEMQLRINYIMFTLTE